MLIKPTPPIPLEIIEHPLFIEKGLTLQLLRTDKTDPVISGNKWFKLKYNLIEAKQQKHHTLLSFGGPYSNHLHALATAGQVYGFNTIGIIRGEEHQPLNPTLSDVTAQGMKLYYIDRKTYRNKHQPIVIAQLSALIAEDDPFNQGTSARQFYLVPEGGTNELAVSGAAEIAAYIPAGSHYACVPCGTGGTMAGIITGLSSSAQHKTDLPRTKVLGFPAMKGGQFLYPLLQELLTQQKIMSTISPWELFYDWSFGGFGKINQQLTLFIDDFEKKYQVELDPVYTAKMMYAIVTMTEMDFFPRGSIITAIHTGGLQGKRGMNKKFQAFLSQAK